MLHLLSRSFSDWFVSKTVETIRSLNPTLCDNQIELLGDMVRRGVEELRHGNSKTFLSSLRSVLLLTSHNNPDQDLASLLNAFVEFLPPDIWREPSDVASADATAQPLPDVDHKLRDIHGISQPSVFRLPEDRRRALLNSIQSRLREETGMITCPITWESLFNVTKTVQPDVVAIFERPPTHGAAVASSSSAAITTTSLLRDSFHVHFYNGKALLEWFNMSLPTNPLTRSPISTDDFCRLSEPEVHGSRERESTVTAAAWLPTEVVPANTVTATTATTSYRQQQVEVDEDSWVDVAPETNNTSAATEEAIQSRVLLQTQLDRPDDFPVRWRCPRQVDSTGSLHDGRGSGAARVLANAEEEEVGWGEWLMDGIGGIIDAADRLEGLQQPDEQTVQAEDIIQHTNFRRQPSAAHLSDFSQTATTTEEAELRHRPSSHNNGNAFVVRRPAALGSFGVAGEGGEVQRRIQTAVERRMLQMEEQEGGGDHLGSEFLAERALSWFSRMLF
eukprot:GHVS01074430.1.p1 GENE.GHVS01074430.1~~GHVS01074430.1.p1  ORF type:complete len:504 (-),score=112.23 GHVS01074430.1:234-1745(-)